METAKTYYPKEQYQIKISNNWDRQRTSDYEDRLYIANASNYMPPIPPYERVESGVWKLAPLKAFIRCLIP